MVKAIIDIDEDTNKVLNILKAQHGLRDKSQAINKLAKEYREIVLESEFRPEYIHKLLKVQQEPIIRLGPAADLRKRYGLK